MKRIFLTLALTTVLAGVMSGCNDFIAERMVAAPNGGRVPVEMTAPSPPGMQELKISVGPPDATLAAWVYEPKAGTSLRGTVLALHGFINDHSQMQGVRRSLCDVGYRVVLLDLRGHGDSTGEYITFGVDDAHDLMKVTTYLQEHQLCGATVGVYGASYGAATAILYAGADPRVTAVVAVALFASLREEAPYFGKHLLPVPGAFMSQDDYVNVVNKMGKVAGFDPDASSPVTAIRNTKAHVRLFHGDADMIVPSESSEELAAAAPDRTELTMMPGRGHLSLCFDLFGDLHVWTREWFDKYLAVQSAGK